MAFLLLTYSIKTSISSFTIMSSYLILGVLETTLIPLRPRTRDSNTNEAIDSIREGLYGLGSSVKDYSMSSSSIV